MDSTTPEERFFKELIKHRTENRVVEFYDQYAEHYDAAVAGVNYEQLANYSGEFLRQVFVENSDTPIDKSEVSYKQKILLL